MPPPKLSIVTVVYNNRSTIENTLESVRSQDYPHREHIVIDGNSKDGTTEIIKAHQGQLSHFVSEPDRGMYDAMNKGIGLAKGDYIGILNADDFFESTNTLSQIAQRLEQDPTDCLYGDVQFVSGKDPSRIVRYYSSKPFRPDRFARGLMPAHPTFYAKRELFEKFGGYRTDFKIAADYELLVRYLWVNKISYQYFPQPLVRMRTGGTSNASLATYWTLNTEVVRACRVNGLKTSLPKILSKYFIKFMELRRRVAT
jgi:glycosyltransferase involved in cell wall biosynthesis